MRTPRRNPKPAQAAPTTDAAGHAFDASRYVAPDDFTKAGTFRLLPGMSHAE